MTLPVNPIPILSLFQPQPQSVVLANLLEIYASNPTPLPITAWNSGDAALTLSEGWANQLAAQTSQMATIIQGGFLNYASNVTADPSVTPGAAPGWLDILAQGLNVSNGAGGLGRIQATFAPGSITFTSTASAAGPFAPGTLHVANSALGTTYSNTTTFSIAGGTIASPATTTTGFQADVAGKGSSAGPGTITSLVSSILGVSCTNLAAFVGVNAESNAALVTRCQAKLGSLSPNGPRAAYDYVSRTIPLPSPALTLSSGNLLTPNNPVTRTKQVVTLATGTVNNYVASAAGAYVAPNAYTGSANLAITGVTNANPAQITVTAHGYTTGDNIFITGTGITALDGNTFSITVTGANTFTVAALSGATSTTGAAYRQSDLDLIDKTVQTYVVPLGVTCVNASAPANNIVVSGTIYLRRGSTLTATIAQANASAALAAYFAALPLGGDDLGGATSYFLVSPMAEAVEASMPSDVLECVITSPPGDVIVTTPQDVATLVSVNFSVVGEV